MSRRPPAARLLPALLPLLLLAVAAHPAGAAGAPGAPPWSLRPGVELLPLDSVPVVVMTAVDEDALRAEDAARTGREKNLRVGFPIEVDIAPGTAGRWEDLGGGDRLWRVGVRSDGARWLVLGFGWFRPAAGAELRVFDASGATVLGPFTSADERDHGQLWLPPVAGDALYVELFWPAAHAGRAPVIHLGTVSHGYRPVFGIGHQAAGGDDPEPDAGPCEIDINCPLGANWQDDKHGVVNLLSGGSGYCSGSLIANANTACKDYVLTANHCVSSQGGAAGTVFQFNYERPACNSGTPPSGQTVSGSNLRATYSPSDFTLLEMSSPAPAEYLPYYNGWTRSTTPASPEAWGLHHPQNDEKKISRSPEPLVNGTSWGPDHWRVNWWDDAREGVTEPGSSGSPLFDPQHRIVGQLHGGDSSCSAPPSGMWDEYGKVDVSWTGGGTPASRLSDWLDPSGTGAIVQDGYYATECGSANAPKLAYESALVDDASSGNGNGVLDPGERATLVVAVRNKGGQPATSVAGTLSTTAPGVGVPDPEAAWPDIAASAVRDSLPPHFLIELGGDVACGAALPFHLVNTAAEAPNTWSSDFTLFVGTPQASTAFSDDMEAGPGTWVSQSLAGTNTWTRTSQVSHSPTHSWVIPEQRVGGDTVLLMAPLNDLGGTAQLTFQHRFSTENNYDGGVLEYSTNAGATWIDAKPLFVSGGYNSSIVATTNSPLRGRDCWAGESGGWKPVVVNLSSLAGQDVRIRWRFATNQQAGVGAGWAVDDVVVASETYTCAPVRPGEARDLRIHKVPEGYRLDWAAPDTGAAPSGYSLYRRPLPTGAPRCEADLGSGTSAVLATLTPDHGFLVVARNASGEGSYGRTSAGDERPAADPSAACP